MGKCCTYLVVSVGRQGKEIIEQVVLFCFDTLQQLGSLIDSMTLLKAMFICTAVTMNRP